MSQYVNITIAARLLDLGGDRVRQMCGLGVFKTAHKPGHGRTAQWKILRSEVINHKLKSHVREDY